MDRYCLKNRDRIPISGDRAASDLDRVFESFERTYAQKYAEQARSPELGHNFTQLTVRGSVDIVKPEIPEEPLQGPDELATSNADHVEKMVDVMWDVAGQEPAEPDDVREFPDLKGQENVGF